MIVLPLTIMLIFMILYAMFGSLKWAILILANVAMAPFGGMLALLLSRTHLAYLPVLAFWLCLASPCKPALSCWNTSTKCASLATRLKSPRSKAPCFVFDRS